MSAPTIALLGGGFSDDPDTLLDDFVLAATGRPRPKVCFLPTASGDAPGYIEKFHAAFGPPAPLTDGLGLLPGSLCPHYDSEPARRPGYLAAVNDRALPAGWAVDDGAAALFTDGRLTDVVTRREGATLRRVQADGDGPVRETARTARVLAG
ncbi:Type 1 glutamine amidotransferase-like domain-containing protein [Streptomyces lydicus]|uniref:Type 1 glutamine amidotransferase-like domain-containing protein n=1 Tax=Streptomyces lydicus TaxID=47763 RepID=UPI00341C1029